MAGVPNIFLLGDLFIGDWSRRGTNVFVFPLVFLLLISVIMIKRNNFNL